MKFEKRKVVLKRMSEAGSNWHAKLVTQLKLTEHQAEYVAALAEGKSVEEIFLKNLEQKQWTDFVGLWNLLEILFKNKLILEPLYEDFTASCGEETRSAKQLASARWDSRSAGKPWSYEEFVAFPFFRSLPPAVQDLLFRQSRLHEIAPACQIIRHGDMDRRLFALLEGQVGVYAALDEHRKIRKHVLPSPSVFGERGFFLNQPRSADIVTLTQCRVASILFPNQLDDLIQKDKAENLSYRLFVLNTIESSPFFQNFSAEIRDRFAFLGKILPYKEQSVVVKEGEFADSMYFVIQGSLSAYQGKTSIRVMKAGDSFGEIALFVNGGQRSASVVCQSECLLLEIRWQDLISLLSQNLKLAKEFQELAVKRLRDDENRKSRVA